LIIVFEGENSMNKFAVITLGAVLSVAAGGSFAAQPFGRDSVYVQPGQTVPSYAPSGAAGKSEVARFGRDSVYVSKDSPLSKPSTVAAGTSVTLKPGRA
jgi:hypothetical protein